MKVSFQVKIGQTTFNVEDEVANDAEFFHLVDFWHSLPVEGPNGEQDLYISHRTPQGYDYYEILCPSAKMKFQMGQLKEEKGKLFPKEWVPFHEADEHEEQDERSGAAEERKASSKLQEPQAVPTVDERIRTALAHFGATNPGLEKKLVMETLSLRAGKLVSELSDAEKTAFLNKLAAKAKTSKRAA